MGTRDAPQLCTSIQHHLHPPYTTQELLLGPQSQGTLGLRAQRQPGEKLEKASGELEGLSQPVPVIFWRVFGFWGGSLPQRHSQRGAVGSGAVRGWWLSRREEHRAPLPPAPLGRSL